MDFEAVFFSRLHFLEKEIRVHNSSLEFIWNTSDDLKKNIFTSIFYGDSYGPPPGFCFDGECLDEPIMDNNYLEEYNVDQRAEEFIAFAKEQASHQRTNHVMFLMGGDFQYTSANRWYTNLDKLIKFISKNQTLSTKVNIFYSTPTCYLLAVKECNPKLPTRSDDFFPYASSNHSFWTGFYTSRPTFKGFVRQSSALLQLVKKLQTSVLLFRNYSILQNAVALAQHHDAITGTARENVTRDYELRLSRGWDEAQKIINDISKKLNVKLKGMLPEQQVICRDLNTTQCNATKFYQNITLTAYNSNSHPMSTVLRIPIYSRSVVVQSSDNKLLNIQINKAFYNDGQLRKPLSAPYELLIPTNIPAIGFTTLFITSKKADKKLEYARSRLAYRSSSRMHKIKASNTITMTNEYIALTFDSSGELISILNRKNGKLAKLRQEFFLYRGMGFTNAKNQSSGAYIFRPNGTQPERIANIAQIDYIEGLLINETRQVITPWISQVIRLYSGKNFVEFEWTIGPIPKEFKNSVTKEIVTRYITEINSAGIFYTDSNGRQMIKRTRNQYPSFPFVDTEQVAGNYYPINDRIFIRDSENQLTIFTDRSQGGSSLNDGEIEIMLHRRSFYDDNFGVGEALDEPGDTGKGLVVRGRHWLMLNNVQDSTLYRTFATELYHSPLITTAERKIAPEDYSRTFVCEYSALEQSLPEVINIISMDLVAPQRMVIRFEHILQSNDDVNLSKPIEVDLNVRECLTDLRLFPLENSILQQ
ncbi:unnamed protein product [Thelazia callipaeda]|uniref:Alpha-mannosidase n=1 Tax=Thelazia callipaeda TaxID=103827 RepID=A0A0N5CZ81_THECL|nr:unnamed protein product [Thelazia callipaeda]